MGRKKNTNNKKNTNIQNEIFHEIYGKYFQSVAEILKLAIDKKLDKKKLIISVLMLLVFVRQRLVFLIS